MIEHTLPSRDWGQLGVRIPSAWLQDLGFVLALGPHSEQPLVRIHSRCAYGDVFGSQLCDCRAQLEKSMSMLAANGGLLFYLEQEGRGAGNRVKAEAYRAFEHGGVDTFSYYEGTGAKRADLRSYGPVADALREFGVTSVRLITNNPDKIEALASAGINVTREPLIVESAIEAGPYIEAKRRRGHLSW